MPPFLLVIGLALILIGILHALSSDGRAFDFGIIVAGLVCIGASPTS